MTMRYKRKESFFAL